MHVCEGVTYQRTKFELFALMPHFIFQSLAIGISLLFSSSDICTVCAVNYRDFASNGDRPIPGRDASDTVTQPCVMSNLSLSAPAMTLLRESFNKEASVLQTRPGHDVAT